MPNFTRGPGRGSLKSKVGRGCSPHTSVMQDRRCKKVIRAPPDSVWAKHHRIVGASRSTVEQVHVTTATAKETSRTGFPTCGPRQLRALKLDSGERTLPTLPATGLASRKMYM